MPRKWKQPSTDAGRADIIPTGTYSIDWLRSSLGLGYYFLRQEIREGRLRSVRLGKNQFVQGKWWIEWLHARARPPRGKQTERLPTGRRGDGRGSDQLTAA
jgi:hypothetical protein